MKFDSKTVEVLKNFNTINQSIAFKEGNVISTVSPQRTILAYAVIEQEFPIDFAIYDLSQFLGVLSIMPDADVDFGKNQLTLRHKNSKVQYTYASPEVIISSPYKKIPMDDVIASFDLTHLALTNIIKGASVLKLTDIMIIGEDGEVNVKAVNTKESTSNDYMVKVGECDNDFRIGIKVENLKFLNRDYKVEIPPQGFVKFSNDDVSYWVAASI